MFVLFRNRAARPALRHCQLSLIEGFRLRDLELRKSKDTAQHRRAREEEKGEAELALRKCQMFSSAISESSSFEASLGAAQVPYFFLPGAAQVPALLLIYIYTNVISWRPTYIFQFFYMFLLWCLMRLSLNVMRRGLKLRSCLSDSVLSKVWLPWCCTSTFDNINQRCHAQCISVYCLKQAGEIGHAKLNIRKATLQFTLKIAKDTNKKAHVNAIHVAGYRWKCRRENMLILYFWNHFISFHIIS